jgi:hypothetical protein
MTRTVTGERGLRRRTKLIIWYALRRKAMSINIGGVRRACSGRVVHIEWGLVRRWKLLLWLRLRGGCARRSACKAIVDRCMTVGARHRIFFTW